MSTSSSTSDSQESPFKNNCLRGRVALITGGGSGIGYEIAKALGQHGAAVVVMGRRESFLSAAVSSLKQLGIEASFVVGDVRKEEDAVAAVASTLRTHGGVLDTLVNSAAGNFLATAEGLKVKGFRTVLDIDAVGVFNMCHAAFEPLKTSGRGVIINISATLHYGASHYQIHAAAAKAAIDSVTRSLALEWGTFRIRTNGIAPGPIADTAGMTKLAPGVDTQTIESMVAEGIPLGRLGTKWDIAMAAVYLASPAGSFISGDTLVVDGAAWMYRTPPVPREMVADLSRSVEKHSRNVGGAGSPAPPVAKL